LNKDILQRLNWLSSTLQPATMSDEFNVPGPDGDIILRAQGSPSRDFRVHKLVLSLASPVFEDMFNLPQSKSDAIKAIGNAGTEVVDVTDPPRALDLVLRLIYPFPPPNVNNLNLLVEALIITDKYNIEGVRAKLRVCLANFPNEYPLRVYAIACRFYTVPSAQKINRVARA
jgi:hypothetical protein